MTALRVALGQYDTGWHSPELSLERAERLVRSAAGDGARLVVLPEMTTTGFTMDVSRAVPLDDPSVRQLRAIAARHGVWLVAGMALRETSGEGVGFCSNAALAIDPSGDLAALHRKRRLFAFGGEDERYSAGDEPTRLEIEGVRVALFVCYELRFPELFAESAAKVDAMVVIANWPAARRTHWDALLRARAIESQCCVIGVNRIGIAGGLEYDGGSIAIDAWGETLAADDSSGIPLVTIDTGAVAEVRRRYPFLRDRGAFAQRG